MKEIILITIIACLAVLLANVKSAIILNEENLIQKEYNDLIAERAMEDALKNQSQ